MKTHLRTATTDFSSVKIDFNSATIDFSKVKIDFSNVTFHFSSMKTHFSRVTIGFSRVTIGFSRLTIDFSRVETHLSRVEIDFSRRKIDLSRVRTRFSSIGIDFSRVEIDFSRGEIRFSSVGIDFSGGKINFRSLKDAFLVVQTMICGAESFWWQLKYCSGAACGTLGGAVGGAFLRAIGGDALGEGVAVYAQNTGGARQMLFMAGEGFLDVELLKLRDGFVEHYLSVEHLFDKGFKASTHLHQLLRQSNLIHFRF